MFFLTLEPYNNIKDYLHPNLHSIIKEHLDKENNLFCLLPYHGCYYKNRNETRKLIDYGRGNRCLTPAWNFSWKRNIKKKKIFLVIIHYLDIFPIQNIEIFLKIKAITFTVII